MNKLIGYGLQAVAYFGLYMTTGNPYVPAFVFLVFLGRATVANGD